jgi:hypothetical protein
VCVEEAQCGVRCCVRCAVCVCAIYSVCPTIPRLLIGKKKTCGRDERDEENFGVLVTAADRLWLEVQYDTVECSDANKTSVIINCNYGTDMRHRDVARRVSSLCALDCDNNHHRMN